MKRKILLTALISIFTLLISIGGALWLIPETAILINQITGKPVQKIAITLNKDDLPALADLYYGEDNPTIEQKKVTAADGTSPNGTWSLETTKIQASSTTSSMIATKATIVFTPEESNIYRVASATVDVNMFAVATVGNTYYTNLDQALKDANAATGKVTVTALITPYEDRAVVAKTITKNVTLNSGITFTIPHKEGATYGTITESGGNNVRNLEHRQGTTVSPLLKNQITIGKSTTLTINGTLNIGAEIGNNGGPTQGNLSGNYAQILMDEESQIISNGTIDCLGYIKDSTNDGGQVTLSSGFAYTPFIVYDYNNGSHTAAAYCTSSEIGMTSAASVKNGNIAPFTTFDTANIQSKLRIDSTATLIGYADLYTDAVDLKIYKIPAQHNLVDISLISSSNSTINLAPRAYAIVKYDASSQRTQLDIHGGASTGALTMTLTVAIMTATVDMSTVAFPVSWKYDVHLYDGNYTFATDYKFLSGSSLAIHDNATVNIPGDSNLIFYPESKVATSADPNSSDGVYQTSLGLIVDYPAKDAAKLTNNGTLNVSGGLGGKIGTTRQGSFLYLSKDARLSVTEIEGRGYRGSGVDLTFYFTKTDTITETAMGEDGEKLTAGTNGNLYEANSSKDWAICSEYEPYIVNFNPNYTGATISSVKYIFTGKATEENPHTLEYFAVPNPTRTHYEFAGWYLDSSCSDGKEALGTTMSDDMTLYAKWTEVKYSVVAYQVDRTGNLAQLELPNYQFTYAELQKQPLTIPLINDLSWYYDQSLSKDSELANGQLTAEIFTRLYENGAIIGDTVYLYNSNIPKFNLAFVNLQNGMTVPNSTNNVVTISPNDYGQYVYDLNALTKTAEGFNNDKNYYNNLSVQYYFKHWSFTSDGDKIEPDENGYITISGDTTIYGVWGKKAIVSFKITKAEVTPTILQGTTTISPGKLTADTTYHLTPDTKFKYTVDKYTGTDTESQSETPPSNATADPNGYYTVSDSTSYTITVSSKDKSGGSCIAAGTLITLADGTQKKVEDVVETDILLVFDHETGRYVESAITFIERDGWAYYNVINLEFSDGTKTRLIYEHGLFDLTLNKYVYIDEFNCESFIGHKFAVLGENGNAYETVTLEKAYITNEYTGCYSLVTMYHLNYFIDGLFSMPGGINGLFNYFEYGEGLKYDEEKMQADIEEYGLFTYEDFKDYIPYEIYEYAFPAKYYKISIAKGLMTWDDILNMIEIYLVKNGVM